MLASIEPEISTFDPSVMAHREERTATSCWLGNSTQLYGFRPRNNSREGTFHYEFVRRKATFQRQKSG